MLLDGLHIPLTTPFYPDGRLYLRKLEHNAERYSRTPAAGLAILTRVGERSLLSDVETREALRAAAGASAPEKVLLADVSRDSVSGTLDLGDFAASLNVDVLHLRLPHFLTGDGSLSKSQRTYLDAVADRSPLPILLEDDSSLTAEVLAELSANPIFLGLRIPGGELNRLREVQVATAHASHQATVTTVFAPVTRRMAAPAESAASGNYIAADTLTGGSTALATAPPRPALKTRVKTVGFQLLTGSSAHLFSALEAGAAGAMLPLSACAPQAVYEVFAAWKDGDPGLAAEKQQRLRAAAELVEERLGVAAIKAGCDLNGYFGGRPRLPGLPLTGEDSGAVEGALANLRN